MRRDAFENPFLFGQQHKDDIEDLIDIANLELLSFEEARSGIAMALDSEDPLKAYWGLIVCSTFDLEATEFEGQAVALCRHQDLLVRTRAAEFLGLTALGDPVPVILEAIYASDDGVEALLILNSLVLLMDGSHTYRFELDKEKLSPELMQDQEVKRRLDYIESRMASV